MMRYGTVQWLMVARPEFGQPARSFELTVSLQEGYEADSKVHGINEVVDLVAKFPAAEDIEFGAEIVPSTVCYSYRSGGKMVVHTEPAAKVMGLFPPNKFGDWTEEQLVDTVAALAARLAEALKQTSIHAVVCGKHYSWKLDGVRTAHEAAREQQP